MRNLSPHQFPTLGPEFDRYDDAMHQEHLRRQSEGVLPEEHVLRVSMPMANARNVARTGIITNGFDPNSMGIDRGPEDRAWVGGGDTDYRSTRVAADKHIFGIPEDAGSEKRPIFTFLERKEKEPSEEGPLFGDVRVTLGDLGGRKVTVTPGYTHNEFLRKQDQIKTQNRNWAVSGEELNPEQEAGEYVRKITKPLTSRYVPSTDPLHVSPHHLANVDAYRGTDEAHVWGGPIPLSGNHSAEVFSGTLEGHSQEARETVQALRNAGVRTTHMVYGEYQPTLSETQFGTGKVGWTPVME